jgi:hypothetical protein
MLNFTPFGPGSRSRGFCFVPMGTFSLRPGLFIVWQPDRTSAARARPTVRLGKRAVTVSSEFPPRGSAGCASTGTGAWRLGAAAEIPHGKVRGVRYAPGEGSINRIIATAAEADHYR